MTGQLTEKPDVARWTRAWSASTAAVLLCAASLTAIPTDAAPQTPIRLAIFDFELEDGTAAAFATETADTSRVTEVTAEVRELFAQSGRYLLVDVSGADAPAARTHTLRRITRTEYVVQFQIRDRTGAVVSAATSGLRMGADYSWARGATRLIKDRLLEAPDQR
jgi:Protein of unknown function (DUF2380)